MTKIFLFIITNLLSFFAYGQNNLKDSIIHRYTNVVYGNYKYAKDSVDFKQSSYDTLIISSQNETWFLIDLIANKLSSKKAIPFAKQEMKHVDSTRQIVSEFYMKAPVFAEKFPFSSLYYSTKEFYELNNVNYSVYKFQEYNCYDPFCGQRHGHIRFETGVIYFSVDYGILVVNDLHSIYKILLSLNGKKAPKELVTAILKKHGADEKITRKYVATTMH